MKKEPLILLGHGGFGRELAAWIGARRVPFDVVGFLDDTHVGDCVIGPIKGHVASTQASYLTCFGAGKSRKEVRMEMEARGARFTSLVFPDVMFASDLSISRNSIFLGVCSISSDVVIGNDVLIQGFSVVGHDVEIFDGCTISSHAFIGGNAKLGPFCTIHPHAVVLPHVEIGEGAVVGAGSVVIRDVEPYTTVFGTPAKMISRMEPHD